jgi:release factor glutamine methyltransferase
VNPPTRRAVADRIRPAAGTMALLEAKWLIEEAAGDSAGLERMILRRLAREPLDRIIGRRGFWTLDLAVTPDVLSPRPDTETIVRAVLEQVRQSVGSSQQPRILDLGTGSAAILLALLAEFPNATGLGVDASEPALAVARDNAARCGLGGRAAFLHGGWNAVLGQTFDIVVSNPPYIPTGVIPTLDREVRDHDPHLALDGGADGLECYRDILPLLTRLLAPGGFAVLEIGAGQGEDVSALARAAGLDVLEIRPDFGGVPRAAVLRVPS